jgi:hypothetical protein
MTQTSLSGNSKTDAVLSGYQWGDVNGRSQRLSYSFPDNGSTWPFDYGSGEPFYPYQYATLNTTQRNEFKDILDAWADVANLTFSAAADSATSEGDIRIAFSTIVSGNVAGHAYLPISTQYSEAGDIWLNPDDDDFSLGSQGYATIIHELGHALGLKHSFDVSDVNTQVLTGDEDSTQYTVMSYTDYDGAGYTSAGGGLYYETAASTPMLYDIAAIQFLYGANTTTRNGDDVYTFSNSSAELKTIWDAGGNDTFDLSNQTFDMKINLNEGTFSSLGVITHKLVGSSIRTVNEAAVDNIAIAFNVDIENAIGGSGDDTITGNELANKLTGGAGNDTIIGGLGTDVAYYSGNYADYNVSVSQDNVTVNSNVTNEGVDTLTDVELLQFQDALINTASLASTPTTPAEVDTSPTEGSVNSINYFLLQIDHILTTDATVTYSTSNGSAIAGEDYVSTSGTATIRAGTNSTAIAVEIIGDSVQESNESFYLNISNPVGGNFPIGFSSISAMHTIVDDDAPIPQPYQLDPLEIIGVNDAITV